MLTLTEVKNIVAVSKGYISWEEMENWYVDHNFPGNIAVLISAAWNEVAKKYATAACDEQRRICATEVPIGMPYEQEAEACVLNAPLPTLK